jgi:hypothetical protein
MEMIQRTLEVERVVNLIAAFGWNVESEKVEGDKITITIEKTIVSETGPDSAG